MFCNLNSHIFLGFTSSLNFEEFLNLDSCDVEDVENDEIFIQINHQKFLYIY